MSKGTDYLQQIAARRGIWGIASLCSSNDYVLKAALEFARDKDQFVLIEATANQVNQYGGYTGQTPEDFKNHVHTLAACVGLSADKVILGGDHLGPVVFADKDEQQAMSEAQALICAYVAAGFEKIHIDTSMRLGSDPPDRPLSDDIIAARGAQLCSAAEEAHQKAFGKKSDIVYVVGSEVPVPGGTQAEDDELKLTSPNDLEKTLDAFESAFMKQGLREAFKRVIAVVVQPGVEFGDDTVHDYCSSAARTLTDKLSAYHNLIFEGHSTDYQTQKALCEMVRDGIRILKVGPELTYALREALFALQYIESELGGGTTFLDTLEHVMTNHPDYWQKYYSGAPHEIALKRKYSYSDRWRYYAGRQQISEQITKLIAGFDAKKIPMTLISQFMPAQYTKIREKKLALKSEELVKDRIKEILQKYNNAVCISG